MIFNRLSIYTEKSIVEREVDIQKELRHENIVKLYTSFKTKYAIFFVLELLTGTLHSFMKTKKANVLSVNEIARMTQDVSKALVYHRRGVIHRDLKPQKVLHSDAKIYKISDFGTATDER